MRQCLILARMPLIAHVWARRVRCPTICSTRSCVMARRKPVHSWRCCRKCQPRSPAKLTQNNNSKKCNRPPNPAAQDRQDYEQFDRSHQGEKTAIERERLYSIRFHHTPKKLTKALLAYVIRRASRKTPSRSAPSNACQQARTPKRPCARLLTNERARWSVIRVTRLTASPVRCGLGMQPDRSWPTSAKARIAPGKR